MKTMLRPLGLCLALLFSSFAHAQWAALSAAHIEDASGALLAQGEVCFQPVDNNNHPIGLRVGSTSGQAFGVGCANVVNGAISGNVSGSGASCGTGGSMFCIPDSSQTMPVNACLRMTVKDARGVNVTPPGYTCLQPSSAATSWCAVTNNVLLCNLDQYPPALPANEVVPYPNLMIGNVTTSSPGQTGSASISGTNPNWVLSLSLPTPTFSLGTMTVGANAYDYSATLTPSGSLGWLMNIKFPLAPSATDTTKLPLAGGTLTGPLILGQYPAIDVLATGAKYDGTTDDTAAFQAAVNQACASSSLARTIRIPAGSYLINATIQVDCENVILQGMGAQNTHILWGGSSGPLFQLDHNKQASIASITRNASGVVTATFSVLPANDAFIVGHNVTVSGVVDTSYNGTFAPTAVTSTTATWSQAGAASSSSGGTITANYDNFDYDGKGAYFAVHDLSLSVNVPTTLLLGQCSYTGYNSKYTPGSIGIQDWRGGSLDIQRVNFHSFDYPFWGVQSDLDTMYDVAISGSHSGGYIGPRSDQLKVNHAQGVCDDTDFWVDSAEDAVFDHWTTDSSGSASSSPLNITANYARGASDIQLNDTWFENYNGSNTSVYQSFVDVTASVGAISGITVDRPFFITNLTAPATNEFIRFNDGVNDVEVRHPMSISSRIPMNYFWQFTGSGTPSGFKVSGLSYFTLPSTPVLDSGSGTLSPIVEGASGNYSQVVRLETTGPGLGRATSTANSVGELWLEASWWNTATSSSQSSHWSIAPAMDAVGTPGYYELAITTHGAIPSGVTPSFLVAENWQNASVDGTNNQPSWPIRIQGQYGNGSTLATDVWTLSDVLGTGTAPTSWLVAAHSGSPGAPAYGAPGFAICTTAAAANCYPVLPAWLRGYHGSSSDSKAQLSDGTGTGGDLAKFNAGGGITDSGVNLSTGSGAPSGSCTAPSMYFNTAGTSGSAVYACVGGAWSDIK